MKWIAMGLCTVNTEEARALLNSERIELKFGSYAVEVLEKCAQFRVSNLFSVHGGRKITRSFAVVQYATGVDFIVPEEHEAILKGASIGKIFLSSGWKIEKRHSFLGEVQADEQFEPVYALMGDLAPCVLALHVYEFVIKKQGVRHLYGTVSEVHHPDHLRLNDLKIIFDEEQDKEETENVEEMINLVQQKMCGV